MPEPTPDRQEISNECTFGGQPVSGKTATTTTSSLGLTTNLAGLESFLIDFSSVYACKETGASAFVGWE
jgi:hypothetical protein